MNARLNASNVVFGLLAFAALAYAPGSLSAEPSSGVPQIAVDYDDLNLASASGVETLYRRIQRAGDRVCGPRPANAEFRRLAGWNGCRETAIANAVEAVDQTLLSALHRGPSPATALAGARVAK